MRFEFSELQKLIETGRIKSAYLLCKKLLRTCSPHTTDYIELQARCAFLEAYLKGNFNSAIRSLRTMYLLAAAQTPRDHSLCAKLAELLARTIALKIGWNLARAQEMEEVQELFSRAFELYSKAEQHSEALSVLLTHGQLCLNRSQADPDQARTVFELVQELSRTHHLRERYLEARLGMAELEFDRYASTHLQTMHLQTVDLLFEFPAYCKLRTESASVADKNFLASTYLSHGQRLMRHGLDGHTLILRAHEIFAESGNLKCRYSALASLSTWFLQKIDPRAALPYLEQSLEVAEEMGVPVFCAITKMGIANYHLSQGQGTRVQEITQQVYNLASRHRAVRALSGLALANHYFSLNDTKRAQALVEGSLSSLRSAGPSTHLSLGYLILGNIVSGNNDWPAALRAWKRSFKIDRTLKDSAGQIQKLQCIALAETMITIAHGTRSDLVHAYDQAVHTLKQALRIIQRVDPSYSDALLASIHQVHGQIALMCKRPVDSLKALRSALEHYSRAELPLQVAFTEAQLGILCYELGRQGHPHFFVDAAHFQERAFRYFKKNGLRDLSWRVAFHLALVEMRQSGQLPVSSLGVSNVDRALGWLREAALDIEQNLINGGKPMAAPVTGLTTNAETVYKLAVQLAYYVRSDLELTLRWLSRKALYLSLSHSEQHIDSLPNQESGTTSLCSKTIWQVGRELSPRLKRQEFLVPEEVLHS